MISSASFKIDLHIYPYTVLCSFGQGEADFIQFLRGHKIKKSVISELDYSLEHAEARAIHYKDYLTCVIRTRRVPKTPEQKGDLAHEIDHISTTILNSLGLYRTNASEEAYTYLAGYITSQVYLNLKECRKKQV